LNLLVKSKKEIYIYSMKYFNQFESNNNGFKASIEINSSNNNFNLNINNPNNISYEDFRTNMELQRVEQLSTPLAYAFAIPGFFGLAGMHRLYMGKIASGILYFLTGGFFFIGTIYDLITMENQMSDIKNKARMTKFLRNQTKGDNSFQNLNNQNSFNQNHTNNFKENIMNKIFNKITNSVKNEENNNIDNVLFELAKSNQGIITVPEFALKTGANADQAKDYLENTAKKGLIQMAITKMGHIVYYIPEYITENKRSELEIE